MVIAAGPLPWKSGVANPLHIKGAGNRAPSQHVAFVGRITVAFHQFERAHRVKRAGSHRLCDAKAGGQSADRVRRGFKINSRQN